MSDEWKSETPKANDDKSWKLLEKAVLAGVQEQRRARRWGIFFKSLTFIYLFVVLLAFSPFGSLEKSASRSGSHTALIEVKGMIADDEPASADNIVTALHAAFKDEGTKGIVLRINSPGGSPVQSGYIYDEIRRLRGEHPNVKV
ncbi:S49 family peptidase, partial [Pseudomonas aeruginosa]